MNIDASSAVKAAAHWARPYWISAGAFREAIISTDQEVFSTCRLRWHGRTRKVVLRRAPATLSDSEAQTPCRPVDFDPWKEDPATLPVRTLRHQRCPTCEGSLTVTCPVCDGERYARCSHCGGGGQSYSTRSRRMIRCPDCRGKGRKRCSCQSGRVLCQTCEGRGGLASWLEIAEERFDRIEWTEENLLFQDLTSGTAGIALLPERHWSGSSVIAAPREVQDVLYGSNTFAALNAKKDRLDTVEMDLYRAAIWQVRYQLCGDDGSIKVQDWDLRILEGLTSRKPLEKRKGWLTRGTLVVAGAGILLALFYGLRHPYFTSVPNFRWLWGAALLSALFVLPLLALAALPRRSAARMGLAALPLLFTVGFQALLATTGYPSLQEAQEFARAGDTERALSVAAACADLKIDDEEARHLHDQLLLSKALRIETPKEAWTATGWRFRTEDGQRRAAQHAVQVTALRAESLQAEGAWQASERVLDLAPQQYQSEPPLLERRWEVLANAIDQKWGVIRSRDETFSDRLEACQWVDRFLPLLASLGPPPRPVPVEQDRAEATCERIQKEQQQEIARQRREEERERKRQERAAASAYRKWALAPLLCRDGTPSPSCICGQSSRRGCCSHHGGVDGCTAPYP